MDRKPYWIDEDHWICPKHLQTTKFSKHFESCTYLRCTSKRPPNKPGAPIVPPKPLVIVQTPPKEVEQKITVTPEEEERIIKKILRIVSEQRKKAKERADGLTQAQRDEQIIREHFARMALINNPGLAKTAAEKPVEEPKAVVEKPAKAAKSIERRPVKKATKSIERKPAKAAKSIERKPIEKAAKPVEKPVEPPKASSSIPPEERLDQYLTPEERETIHIKYLRAHARRYYKIKRANSMPGGKAALLQEMARIDRENEPIPEHAPRKVRELQKWEEDFSLDELNEMTLQQLRSYAAVRLKIKGASKMKGGREALLGAIKNAITARQLSE